MASTCSRSAAADESSSSDSQLYRDAAPAGAPSSFDAASFTVRGREVIGWNCVACPDFSFQPIEPRLDFNETTSVHTCNTEHLLFCEDRAFRTRCRRRASRPRRLLCTLSLRFNQLRKGRGQNERRSSPDCLMLYLANHVSELRGVHAQQWWHRRTTRHDRIGRCGQALGNRQHHRIRQHISTINE